MFCSQGALLPGPLRGRLASPSVEDGGADAVPMHRAAIPVTEHDPSGLDFSPKIGPLIEQDFTRRR